MRRHTPVITFALSVALAGTASAAESSLDAIQLNNLGVTAARDKRYAEAASYLRHALELSPDDAQMQRSLSAVLTDWAIAEMQAGDADEAIELLEEAVQRDSQNGVAWLGLGDAQYMAKHDFAAALRAWRQARGRVSGLHERALTDRLTRVERDHALERGLPTHETAHFYLRLQGAPDPALAAQVGTLLETLYARLARDFEVTPPRLSVIIYSDETFERVSPRDWALGLFDGRLRIRREEVTTPSASPLLAHELTHAFIHHAYRGRIPLWLNEGIAQAEEWEQLPSESEMRAWRQVVSGRQWVPLEWLDKHFRQPADTADLERAYVQARIVAIALARRHGWPRVHAFLRQLAGGVEFAQAFDDMLAPQRWARVNQGILE